MHRAGKILQALETLNTRGDNGRIVAMSRTIAFFYALHNYGKNKAAQEKIEEEFADALVRDVKDTK